MRRSISRPPYTFPPPPIYSNPRIPMLRRDVSGELDVFDARSYFATPLDHVDQEVLRDKKMEKNVASSYEGEKCDRPSRPPRGRLAAFLNSLLSQARSKKKLQSKSVKTSATSCTDPKPPSSSCDSKNSAPREVCKGDHGHELGEVMRDRRLEGIRVVRGGEERWVVSIGGMSFGRCRPWEEEMFIANGVAVEEHDVDDGWGSDSCSDLFELEDLSSASIGMP